MGDIEILKLENKYEDEDAYQKVWTLIEYTVNVLLCGCSVPVDEDMAIRTIHPPYAWDGHCSVVWALRHSCCLRGGRWRQNEWLLLYGTQTKSLVAKNSVKKSR
jgi:hypothetical protein